jgi:hypothetical protein
MESSKAMAKNSLPMGSLAFVVVLRTANIVEQFARCFITQGEFTIRGRWRVAKKKAMGFCMANLDGKKFFLANLVKFIGRTCPLNILHIKF